MHKLHFSIHINAPREKVWNTMLEDKTYREWTIPFNPGSYFKGSWEKGEKILFLGPSPDGNGEGGMVARIADNRPQEFVSVQHLGIINNGVEDTTSEEVKSWTPAFENYTFTDENGGTRVDVDIDVHEKYKDMFEDMWPKALAELKRIAEK